MKPIAIFRHSATEGPGYFAIYLARCGLPWRLIRLDRGEAVPVDPAQFSGIAFMGGPMSVNDPLPWIGHATQLIRRAMDRDIPVIGHCLGGQLLAKALGAGVTANPRREIGWHDIEVTAGAEARRWFGSTSAFEGFHWHGETFGLPEQCTRILSSRLCTNQAFSLGKNLAMQCHIEMTCDLVDAWCVSGADEIAEHRGDGVQSVAEIETDLARRLANLHRVADSVYARWVEGVVR
jgi:GMP synthase-like glutamine amidotransferase